MADAAKSIQATKQTTLQRTITAALNELGVEAGLVAIFDRQDGDLVVQGYRGFTPRETLAILRALSGPELSQVTQREADAEGEAGKAVRLRMITPAAKSLLAVPLRFRQRVYGVLVVGRKETATFAKKEKALVETAGEDITNSLEGAGLFDTSLILGRPLVTHEPTKSSGAEAFAFPPSYASPETQEQIVALLKDLASLVAFDRAWVTFYDPIAGSVEVLGVAGEPRGDHKRDLKPGQRLALDASAAGWAVRHRKPRLDNDLASTQGRFLDHKHLYKDKFKSSLVLPFFLRGQVGGTVTLASTTPAQYALSDVKTLEPLIGKLVGLLQEPVPVRRAEAEPSRAREAAAEPVAKPPSEPLIRKQERQAAIGEFSAFLATEVREPLACIRAQLEEIAGEGILDFDPQTRVENAMRDLIRVEALLNEILDFAKPLDLNRRTCRITDVIESALTVVATDLEVTRIQVTKDYPPHLSQVRCDEAKMQQVFLSIIKNALEAMTPGGHLHIEVTQPRSGRSPIQILIKNDGAPIPTEYMGKVFEPFFTTKRSGTGLGLATVKKIVEEHQGQISIASGPGQGTTVIIRIPPIAPRGGPYRRHRRGRRPPRTR